MFGERMALVSSLAIRDELAVANFQNEQWNEIIDEYQKIARQFWVSYRQLDELTPENVKTLRAEFDQKRKGLTEKIGEILLPHQISRIDELRWRFRLERNGFANTVKLMCDDFETSSNQRELANRLRASWLRHT